MRLSYNRATSRRACLLGDGHQRQRQDISTAAENAIEMSRAGGIVHMYVIIIHVPALVYTVLKNFQVGCKNKVKKIRWIGP